MFDKDERTKERVAAYVEALEEERKGYEARLLAVSRGFTDRGGLTDEMLKSRLDDVDASIKWAKTKPKEEKEAA